MVFGISVTTENEFCIIDVNQIASKQNSIKTKPQTSNGEYPDQTDFQKVHSIKTKQFPNAQALLREHFTAILSKNQLTILENFSFSIVKTISIPGNIGNFFIDEKSLEFYFFSKQNKYPSVNLNG